MKSVQWEIEWRTLGEMNGCILKVERVNDSEQIEMTPNIEWVLGVGNLEKSNLEGTSIYAPNSGEIFHFCQRKPGICGENLGQSTNQGNAVPIAPEGRSGLAQSEPFILSVRFSHLKKCMEEEASVSQSSLPHENNEQGIGRWLYS